MGDPAGVGPEVVARAVHLPEIHEYCTPIVIGDAEVLERAFSLFARHVNIRTISSAAASSPLPGSIEVIDLGLGSGVAPGKASPGGGAAAAAYIRRSADMAQAGEVDAIVTAPISKESLRMAGLPWPGHTEMLAELTGADEYAMMLVGGLLRVILVTIHTPLRSVPDQITRERVFRTIRCSRKACEMLGIRSPRIAVAGLNPHAGEAGLFGDEELRAIAPAVRDAQAAGIPVDGPYPPDSIFHKAYLGEVDIVVCMYHDQGLIPLKMIAFDEGVNVTVGLPIVRTSPDHGTAFDIAWKGRAKAASMAEAIKLASRLKT